MLFTGWKILIDSNVLMNFVTPKDAATIQLFFWQIGLKNASFEGGWLCSGGNTVIELSTHIHRIKVSNPAPGTSAQSCITFYVGNLWIFIKS